MQHTQDLNLLWKQKMTELNGPLQSLYLHHEQKENNTVIIN